VHQKSTSFLVFEEFIMIDYFLTTIYDHVECTLVNMLFQPRKTALDFRRIEHH